MANSIHKSLPIFKIAIAVPLNRLFDYLAPKNVTHIPVGSRVLVPFGKSKKVGFVIAQSTRSEIKIERLKAIIEILDKCSLLSAKDFQLLQWASDYYHYPIGEVISAAFPVSLRKGKVAILPQEKHYIISAKGECIKPEQLLKTPKQKIIFEHFLSLGKSLSSARLTKLDKNWRPAVKALMEKGLISTQSDLKTTNNINLQTESALTGNKSQQHAINQLSVKLKTFSVTLLEGVTGSGKTEVYMQVIEKVLNDGLQVIVLLPEITLTPQLESRFRKRFSVAISVSHSKLTERQRHSAWLEIQQGHSAILLGTRSALFTPLQKPGLIILDEEHDSSFKQQQGFRFSARDLAIVRAKLLNIPIILGSATPSLESLHNVNKKRFQLLQLPERAGIAIEPEFLLFDIRNKILQAGLSEPLLTLIKKTLDKKEQVLLFLNRRGFAPVQICHSCSWVARCHQCDTSLVIHYAEKVLRCHHCNHQQSLLQQCPICKSGELQALGLGTERVEKALQTLFPQQKIIRLDRDSTQRKGTLENHLEQINQGNVDIILGTQMLAKGHHFPNVTLVAILDVDSGLFSIDFHATEKLAQLIVQVAGRAGRAEKSGRVVLQTRQPHHPLLSILLKDGYNAFAKTVLAERQQAMLPPFSFQALLRAYAKRPDEAQIFLNVVTGLIQKLNHQQTLILGPVSAPMAKRAGYYHFQLLLQNTQRQSLHALLTLLIPQLYTLKESKKVRWSLDVDPVDLY
ncbi:MAG: primosomal protein N' [Methylococcales symbiont of Iophon sp. n. MRB-2018]|nr:MAG: primosomal protein N' [Methylococcales symbiont of Iophon sp. n. MRB-2018]KAF3980219.1 MAG: primosomal protein N' [Methylococcales symbiont of Iophon sp. n. MRB-2018]